MNDLRIRQSREWLLLTLSTEPPGRTRAAPAQPSRSQRCSSPAGRKNRPPTTSSKQLPSSTPSDRCGRRDQTSPSSSTTDRPRADTETADLPSITATSTKLVRTTQHGDHLRTDRVADALPTAATRGDPLDGRGRVQHRQGRGRVVQRHRRTRGPGQRSPSPLMPPPSKSFVRVRLWRSVLSSRRGHGKTGDPFGDGAIEAVRHRVAASSSQ